MSKMIHSWLSLYISRLNTSFTKQSIWLCTACIHCQLHVIISYSKMNQNVLAYFHSKLIGYSEITGNVHAKLFLGMNLTKNVYTTRHARLPTGLHASNLVKLTLRNSIENSMAVKLIVLEWYNIFSYNIKQQAAWSYTSAAINLPPDCYAPRV